MPGRLLETAPATEKLHERLRSSVGSDKAARRPLLTHLTADSAWLLSIPIPSSARKVNDRAYFHLLVDSWLKGNHVDVASFISTIYHAEDCALNTVPDVEALVRVIEEAANGTEDSRRGRFDAVMISFEYTDHMHKATLLQIDPSVPIIASEKPARIIKSWKRFQTVVQMPIFDATAWKQADMEPLPAWLKIEKIYDPTENKSQGFHNAFLIIFDGEQAHEPAEALVYTPHGIDPVHLKPVIEAKPPVQALTLLHGLHAITSPMPVNLGAHNGLKVQRALNARYWVGTHDEVSPIWGIIKYILKRQPLTLEDALKKEREAKGGAMIENTGDSGDDMRFTDLRNGDVLVLA